MSFDGPERPAWAVAFEDSMKTLPAGEATARLIAEIIQALKPPVITDLNACKAPVTRSYDELLALVAATASVRFGVNSYKPLEMAPRGTVSAVNWVDAEAIVRKRQDWPALLQLAEEGQKAFEFAISVVSEAQYNYYIRIPADQLKGRPLPKNAGIVKDGKYITLYGHTDRPFAFPVKSILNPAIDNHQGSRVEKSSHKSASKDSALPELPYPLKPASRVEIGDGRIDWIEGRPLQYQTIPGMGGTGLTRSEYKRTSGVFNTTTGEFTPNTDGFKPTTGVVNELTGEVKLHKLEMYPIKAKLKPAADVYRPTTDESKPAAGDSKPVADEFQSNAGEPKPAADAYKPSAGESKPATGDSKPVAEEIKPITSKLKPNAGEFKPNAGELKPTMSELKPNADEFKPTMGDFGGSFPLLDLAKGQLDTVPSSNRMHQGTQWTGNMLSAVPGQQNTIKSSALPQQNTTKSSDLPQQNKKLSALPQQVGGPKQSRSIVKLYIPSENSKLEEYLENVWKSQEQAWETELGLKQMPGFPARPFSVPLPNGFDARFLDGGPMTAFPDIEALLDHTGPQLHVILKPTEAIMLEYEATEGKRQPDLNMAVKSREAIENEMLALQYLVFQWVHEMKDWAQQGSRDKMEYLSDFVSNRARAHGVLYWNTDQVKMRLRMERKLFESVLTDMAAKNAPTKHEAAQENQQAQPWNEGEFVQGLENMAYGSLASHPAQGQAQARSRISSVGGKVFW